MGSNLLTLEHVKHMPMFTSQAIEDVETHWIGERRLNASQEHGK